MSKGRQTALSLSLATLIALRQREERRVESVSVCVHSQIGEARRGVGRQEAAQDISSPSAADATFGPWQLRAALPVVVVVADGVQKAQKKKKNPKKARAKNNKKRKSAEAMPRILNILTEENELPDSLNLLKVLHVDFAAALKAVAAT